MHYTSVLLKRFVLGLTFATLIISSCTYDKEDLLRDPDHCDTQNVRFTKDILPMITQSCGTTSCHSAGGLAPGMLVNYQDVKEMADNGKLLYRISETRDMPPSGPLSDCQIARIRAWIEDGAPDN